MTESGQVSNEQAIWDSYVDACEKAGKKPSVKDFTEWTKALLRDLK